MAHWVECGAVTGGRSVVRRAHLHHDHDISAVGHLFECLLYPHQAATDEHGKFHQLLQPRVLACLLHLMDSVLKGKPKYLCTMGKEGRREEEGSMGNIRGGERWDSTVGGSSAPASS